MTDKTHLVSASRVAILGVFAATFGLASATQARDLDPELRQIVIVSCSQDAFRLCPQSLSSEKDAVACMRAKRAQLDHACRSAYDKVARVLSE